MSFLLYRVDLVGLSSGPVGAMRGETPAPKMVDLVGPVPIALVSTGPTHKDRIKIGEW